MKSKVFSKIVLGAVAGLAALMFVSCGSKISGTYKVDIFGTEAGYTFQSGNKVTAFSVMGKSSGTYTFDESSNIVNVTLDNGETHELIFNPEDKTLHEDPIVYSK